MATKKYEVGGMTDTETCGKPGKPRCRQKFKSKGKSKETKGSILGTLGAIAGGIGAYGAYKKLKKEQKGGVTKYQGGGSTQDKKMSDLAKRGAGPVPKSTVDGTKWVKNTKAPNAKKYQNGGTPIPPSMTPPAAPQMTAPRPKSKITPGQQKPITGRLNGNEGYKPYANPPKPSMNAAEYRAKAIERYGSEELAREAKAIQKKGGTTYKTGGMVNPNAKLQAAKSAGSKGVKSGVNPKAAASKVARGRSGGTSVAPKKATPGRK
jgi:hypothetical protein